MLLLHVGNWMCTPHSWGSVPVVTYSFSPQKVVLKDISLGLKTNLKQFPFEMTKENRIRRNKPFHVSCLSSCSFQDFPSLPHKWLNYSKWWMMAFVLSLAAYTAALRTFLLYNWYRGSPCVMGVKYLRWISLKKKIANTYIVFHSYLTIEMFRI